MAIITTGVVSPNNTIGVRLEINTLLADKPLANLYILALRRFQDIDQANPLSWFQIAGIHGRPYIPFDGVGSPGSFGGYCTHSSILFPTWHRPYLALYEQTLAKHVSDIANEFTNPADKTLYVNAAQRFRIPYWDWAANIDPPDIISTNETVQVTTPRGVQTIKNPLYSYTFHPVYSDFGDGLPDERTWEAWQSTLRYPSSTNAAGRSQPSRMESTLRNNMLTIRDRTYNLLTQATSYEAFSNDGFMGRGSEARYDSLESIHGQLHGLTGANGHMGVVDYAGFDPIFWLHHVDRLFALWQGMNPNQFVVPRANSAGTFTTRRGTVENAESPLHPFYRAPGQFWTSTGVRDTRTLHYTYPELAKWSSFTTEQKRTRLRTEVNTLYGKTSPIASIRPSIFSAALAAAPPAPAAARAAPTPAAAPAPAPPQAAAAPRVAQQPIAAQKVASAPAPAPAPPVAAANKPAVAPVAAASKAPAAPAPAAASKPSNAGSAIAAALQQKAAQIQKAHGNEDLEVEHSFQGTGDWHKTATTEDDKAHYHEWVANIRAEKYAVKTTFFIHIFLGDFTSDPNGWGADKNLVGTHVIFANNLTFTGCEKCRAAEEEHKLVTGTIPLTGALGDKLGKDKLADLNPDLVIPYLKKNLHWRIQGADQRPIERTQVAGLKVSVGHAIVELPDDIASFPKWADVGREAAVTTGRDGGAEDDDD